MNEHECRFQGNCNGYRALVGTGLCEGYRGFQRIKECWYREGNKLDEEFDIKPKPVINPTRRDILATLTEHP